ncbi:LacI family DNA-binding transcriptional regulator [Streptomyces sp. NPDC054962]
MWAPDRNPARPAGLRDVAQAAGVSYQTVSRAITTTRTSARRPTSKSRRPSKRWGSGVTPPRAERRPRCRHAQPLVSAYTTAVNRPARHTERSHHLADEQRTTPATGRPASRVDQEPDASTDQHPRPASCSTNITSRETTSKP